MTTVIVSLSGVGSEWIKPCQHAVTELNTLFKKNGINVVLATSGSKGPTITVKNDPSIQGTAVHGKTSAETDGSGRLVKAEIRLPVTVTINTPQRVRGAGPGILEVIAGHEFVHALGHSDHNTQLMGQTMYKDMGASAGGDRLKSGVARMPPLTLSDESISALKAIWG
jgi:hypothetical protein